MGIVIAAVPRSFQDTCEYSVQIEPTRRLRYPANSILAGVATNDCRGGCVQMYVRLGPEDGCRERQLKALDRTGGPPPHVDMEGVVHTGRSSSPIQINLHSALKQGLDKG